MSRDRILPLALAVPLTGGSDPDVVEIEDCGQVYGDYPPVDDPCPSRRSPTGQHEFGPKDNFTSCIHCGEASRVWD